MAGDGWLTKPHSVASLHLDSKNPRLGREVSPRPPREIIQYLFEHDKAIEVAESIATRGYFPNEPLLAVKENDRLVVIEGNRRLAALKALREPGLLEGAKQRQVGRLSRRIIDLRSIAAVPVTIAPSRRATDRQVAGRHVGTPVLAWQAENRASFILDKLAEGYDNNDLRDELGFSLADIQAARQTRAVADMARSLGLRREILGNGGEYLMWGGQVDQSSLHFAISFGATTILFRVVLHNWLLSTLKVRPIRSVCGLTASAIFTGCAWRPTSSRQKLSGEMSCFSALISMGSL